MTQQKVTQGAGGIRARQGLSGSVRGALRRPAVVGLASALAAGGALAQEGAPAGAPPQSAAARQQPGAAGQQAAAAQQPLAAQDAAAGVQPQGPEYVLPEEQVVGEAEGASYVAPEPSLERLPTAVVDTPQTVTVVPARVIQEQKATTVRDALRNVSGVTLGAGEGGRQGDTFILRGFSGQTDVTRDGVRDLGWYTRDTFNLGGVEVYFGPSSVLFGRGTTGGAINLTTKRPERESFAEVKADAGTAPSGRVELDVNRALTERLQVRVAATGQLASVPGRDVVRENREGVAPSLRLRLSEATVLEADYLYQHEHGVSDYGQPYFSGAPVARNLGVDRSVFYGVDAEAGGDADRVNAHVGTARLRHRLGGGAARGGADVTATLRGGGVDRFARVTAPRNPGPAAAPTTLSRQRFQTDTDNTYLVGQVDVRARPVTGPLRHTLVAGVEATREKREQSRDNLRADVAPGTNGRDLTTDLFTPEAAPDLSSVSRVFQTESATNQWGAAAYVSDQVAIGRYLELLGSARLDVFDTDYGVTTAVAPTATNPSPEPTRRRLQQRDTFFSWRGGVVVHPVEGASVYAMYGTSANPSAEAGTLANGAESLDPEKNRTLEAGAKAELLEGRLQLGGSAFRIEKTNARVAGTDPTVPLVLEGEQHMQGVNLGVAGTVVGSWKVFANGTLMSGRTKVRLTDPGRPLVEQRVAGAPRESLSLWSTLVPVERLTVGGGAVYQGVATANNPTTAAGVTNRVPAFWRFDAVATYALSDAGEVQLNVFNIFDRLTYESFGGGHAVPGRGRSAVLSGRYRF